jgi:hypothetical protein
VTTEVEAEQGVEQHVAHREGLVVSRFQTGLGQRSAALEEQRHGPVREMTGSVEVLCVTTDALGG